jgi:uncharacterized membrane protein YoaT (DUF817 family)
MQFTVTNVLYTIGVSLLSVFIYATIAVLTKETFKALNIEIKDNSENYWPIIMVLIVFYAMYYSPYIIISRIKSSYERYKEEKKIKKEIAEVEKRKIENLNKLK